jgi:molybdate transport system substrate-binding protein
MLFWSRVVAPLRILSAGAAQAVTERVIEAFKRDTGCDVTAEFGAVGAMKAKVTAGAPVDVIILTNTMIDELISAGFVQAGSRLDLGKVGTGVAVRAGTPMPHVSNADMLEASIRGSSRIVCPDPAIATAGKIVLSLLKKLQVLEDVRNRLQFFPNGYAAMNWLARSDGTAEIGITQVTEILPNKGVAFAGPLPDEFQMKTVYSVGLAGKSAEAQFAKDFVDRFKAPSATLLLAAAGYELN